MEITQNQIKRIETMWKNIVKDQDLEVSVIKGVVYGFTTELGALRLFGEYNKVVRNTNTGWGHTGNHQSGHFFRLELNG